MKEGGGRSREERLMERGFGVMEMEWATRTLTDWAKRNNRNSYLTLAFYSVYKSESDSEANLTSPVRRVGGGSAAPAPRAEVGAPASYRSPGAGILKRD
ncbi:hypothetical protein EVAR_16928_1 [Eumeta japonica]|uniref:Uncharacterized protein n=1 Tax=Eumeta variegata TaxID=151549 RepID=A0A4C1TVS0_EUMVA|nr:hypothetical protein EVAR_16928_1 [Eumeta japonica]